MKLRLALIALLCAIPVGAGTARLVQLATVDAPPLEDARFFAAPLPVIVHIVCASTFALLGGLQLLPQLRRRSYHRRVGWVLVGAGLGAMLSGFWMMATYPLPAHDAPILQLFRAFFGGLVVLSLILGARAALRRDYAGHGAWMLRAYAVAMGAGTQSLVLGPIYALDGPIAPVPSALVMAACWTINWAIAELLIRRASQRRVDRGRASVAQRSEVTAGAALAHDPR